MPKIPLRALFLLAIIAAPAVAQIFVDGDFTDWRPIRPLYSDPLGDAGPNAFDLGDLWLAHDADHLYLRIETGSRLNLQEKNDITLFLDTDADATTGFPTAGIGAELQWDFGRTPGFFYHGSEKAEIAHDDIGLATSPTVSSDDFEICLDRHARPDGRNLLFTGDRISVAFTVRRDGDRLPDEGQTVTYSFATPSLPPLPERSIERPPDTQLRVATYNTWRNGVLDPERGPAFARILAAIAPDIVGLQEVGRRNADEIADTLSALLGGRFHHAQVADNAAISRFPIAETFPIGDNGGFLIDLAPTYPLKLLLVVAHPPCCDNNAARQSEFDEIMAFVRDARYPEGWIDIPPETPIFIVGDMNLVSFSRQLATLVEGAIYDQERFGLPFSPDWDDTFLEDLRPPVFGSPCTFTWYRPRNSYTPGRLDYILYTGSVALARNGFVLFTPLMSPELLRQRGLQKDDSTTASDHLPVIGDFVLRDALPE